MINPQDFLKAGQQLHGHKCPAMPMGLRVGAAAMNALGVERAADGQLVALVEIGENHFATCFADGVQMITGCTFGKGNIQRLHRGKWGLTLIDKGSGRSVRVTPRASAILANTETSFFTEYRSKGVPASKVPAEIVEPLVDKVMAAPEEKILDIGEVQSCDWSEPVHSFDAFTCDACQELVIEGYGRVSGERRVCIACHEKLSNVAEPAVSGSCGNVSACSCC